jgi:hypothetical protein
MLTKILFTAAVIAVVVALMRFRRQREALVSRDEPRLVNPPKEKKGMPIGWLASAAVSLMLIASGVLLYNHWQDSNVVISVRVVDASSGKSETYRAYRGDVDDREFVTVDGVRVVLADTERLETSTRSRGQN